MPCVDADQAMDKPLPLRPWSHIALDFDALGT
jgi:hypothetical protein